MKALPIPVNRGLSVLMGLFFLSTILPAQIKIKERVEIAPQKKVALPMKTNSAELPCFAGDIIPNSCLQYVKVLRPCSISASGTFSGTDEFADLLHIIMILGGYDNITNASCTLGGYCGSRIQIELWTWTSCAIMITNVSGSISGNQATFSISGYQSFPHPLNVPFTASVTLQAVPLAGSEPSSMVMSADPDRLTADEEGPSIAEIGAVVLNSTGTPFQYCDEATTKFTFTIENPRAGITINGSETSVETNSSGFSSWVTLTWDGGDLPNGEYTVSIRAEALGFSAVQTIHLTNQQPCFLLSISKSKIHSGESATLSMMQKTWDGTVVPFPTDQNFLVWMNADTQFGRLRSSVGDEGPFVFGRQPFEFIAADTLNFDSVVISIVAMEIAALPPSEEGVEIAASIGIGTKDTLRVSEPIITNVQMEVQKVGVVPNEMKRKNVELLINNLQDQLKKKSTRNGNEERKPASSLEQLQAQLTFEPVKSSTEKKSSLAKMKQVAMIAAETSECRPVVSITIQKASCIVASFPTVSVGDTTIISFVYADSQQPVPTDKLLDIWVLGVDSTSGYLLSSSDSLNLSLHSITQPVRYVAPPSIQGDSLKVSIVAVESDESSAVGGEAAAKRMETAKEDAEKKRNQSKSLTVKNIIGPKGMVIQPHAPTQALINALTQNQCATGGGTVANPQLDHFEIRVISDTIAYTDTLRIVVRAMDKNGSPTRCEFDRLLEFSMEGESEYATFITPQGDTIRSTPAVLRDIPYLDAFQGDVRLAAVTRNPAIRNKPKIVIKLQEDETKKGEKEIIVLEQTLKIVMDSPYEVRPKIPTENGNPELVRQRKKTFGVKLTKGGILTGDHPFRLTTNYINGSGGHDHVDSLRFNSDDNYGLFESRQVDKRIARPMDDTTRSDFMTAYDYLSSIFGDTMKIYLRSQKNPLLRDSIQIVEKIDSLINYQTIESNGQWTFDQSPTGKANHRDNNWCKQEMANNLQFAISDFYDWSLNTLASPFILCLNDMSLQFGGRFDISGKWDEMKSQYHYYHRVGTSADINDPYSEIKVDDKDNKYGKWTNIGEKLKDIFDVYNLKPKVERPIHFELL